MINQMRHKLVITLLSSLLLACLPASATAQPVSECRISTSENQIVSLGFPMKPERLSKIENPRILIIPYRLKGENSFEFDSKDKDIFLKAAENISILSDAKTKISFQFNSIVDIDITAKELDQIKVNVKDT